MIKQMRLFGELINVAVEKVVRKCRRLRDEGREQLALFAALDLSWDDNIDEKKNGDPRDQERLDVDACLMEVDRYNIWLYGFLLEHSIGQLFDVRTSITTKNEILSWIDGEAYDEEGNDIPEDYPFSFDNVCKVLGLDPESLAELLFSNLPKAQVEQKAIPKGILAKATEAIVGALVKDEPELTVETMCHAMGITRGATEQPENEAVQYSLF